MRRYKILRIETMMECNGICSFCILGSGSLKREPGWMNSEFFFNIVDQARELEYEIETIGMNEPLLEPRLFEFFDYIRSRGGKQLLFTNASLLTKDVADILSEYQYRKFIISFHGGSKEVYEKIMGLNFETTVSNIKYLVSLGKIPNYQISIKICNENKDSIDDFKKLWEGYRIRIEKATNWIELFEGGRGHNRCNYLKIPSVFWDGRVAFCCMDAEGEVIIGNLKEQSLDEIINGETYQKYLDYHRRRKLHHLYPCSVCRVIK